jgi:peptide/nickel transport system permease protein
MIRLKLLARNPAGLLGAIMLAVLVLMAFIGPLVVPPARQAHVDRIYQAPSLAHLLGTDFQGRDNLVMLIYGGRDVIILAVVAGLLTTLIACTIGAGSAFFGGTVDSLLMTITDIWLTLPRFLLLVVLASLVQLDDVWSLALLLAVFGWPGLARQVRSQVLSLKQREYVEAARQLDLGTTHIIFREMLPNMLAFITISLIATMTQAIYTQTGLVFLGVVPFGNNWGVLFSLAYAKNAMYLPRAAWTLLCPMGAIIMFQLALVLLSRSLEDVFNPRLRTGG